MKPTLFALVALVLSASASPALADGDVVPDNLEAAVCGFPAAANAINGLPAPAGRCTGPDYVSPLLQPPSCPECSSQTVFSEQGIDLFPGAHENPQPLPGEDVPAQGPFPVGGVQQDVVTLTLFREVGNPENYCITLDPASGAPVTQCIDAGPAGPLAPVLGPISLVNVPGTNVGPTPPVDDDELGYTPPVDAPSVTVDLAVTLSWVESRLNKRLSGAVEVWDPVDLDDVSEVSWFASMPTQTAATITARPYLDGVAQPPVVVAVPFMGQVIAAQQHTLASV